MGDGVRYRQNVQQSVYEIQNLWYIYFPSEECASSGAGEDKRQRNARFQALRTEAATEREFFLFESAVTH
jgi:hypothetical protein